MRGTNPRRTLGLMLAALLAAAICIGQATTAAAQPGPGPGPTPTPSGGGGGGLTGTEVGIAVGVAVGLGLAGLLLKQVLGPRAGTGSEPPTEQGVFSEPGHAGEPGPPSGLETEPPPGSEPAPAIAQQAVRLPQRPGGGGNGRGNVTRRPEPPFVPDELVVEFVANASPQAIDQFARRYRLTRLDSQNLSLIGTSLYRWRILGGRTVASLVGTVRHDRIVASVQPNYVFKLQQQAPPEPGGQQDEVAQYALGKVDIAQAHKLATGKGVVVAVIDSAIDESHPDLDGSISKNFDALGGEKKPHQHGTAIAGAVASHGQLKGMAPEAQILAARAFDDDAAEAKGTSFAIYKSLQWAADNHARIINMSFAGPADADLHRLLAAAYQRDIILIAAAGNAGARSPPLYPAADANVIAVTATDSDDHLFKMANRGKYVAVAAPGVEVLALAPDSAYQITSGTSIAAAEVSGIVALLLERKPSLKPSEVRTILSNSAKPLGPKAPNPEFGAGLVNAYQALLLEAKSVRLEPGSEQARR